MVTLASFPLMAGASGSLRNFNAEFFAAQISAITQGWSLSPVAGWLHINRPACSGAIWPCPRVC
jgi:NhaP-type Na+/H+ and K+/H+ antiporter